VIGIFDDNVLQRIYDVLITVFENCMQDHAVSVYSAAVTYSLWLSLHLILTILCTTAYISSDELIKHSTCSNIIDFFISINLYDKLKS